MKIQSVFVLLLFCALSVPLSAQGFRFGLKGGAGISNLQFGGYPADPSEQPRYAGLEFNRSGNYFPSIWLGVVTEYDFTPNILLSAGGQLTPRFAQTKKQLPDYENQLNLNIYYFQVPLTLHYHTRKWFFGAGAYGGICLAGRYKLTETFDKNNMPNTFETGNSITFGSDAQTSNLRRLDFGLHGEIGYVFKTLRLSLIYDHGLANNVPTGIDANQNQLDGDLKQRALYAMVTYYWLAK